MLMELVATVIAGWGAGKFIKMLMEDSEPARNINPDDAYLDINKLIGSSGRGNNEKLPPEDCSSNDPAELESLLNKLGIDPREIIGDDAEGEGDEF